MSNKALLLDRDGIVNIDHGYAAHPKQIEFVDGIFELCDFFQQRGYLLIIVTNQSGIARGYYTEQQFLTLMEWISSQFLQHGVTLTDTFYCPHHPVSGKGDYLQDCCCRKPQPGMLLDAAQKYQLDLQQSVMLGDHLTDMQAAQRAGVGNRFLFNPTLTIAPTEQQDFHRIGDLKKLTSYFV
jgi:D-glycero-D-manno-heptose 1,7-bisphosphate phosphatase